MFRLPSENDQLMENQKLTKIIEDVKNAAKKEDEYESFYNYLLTIAPNNEEAEIIKTIRNDTRRHYEFFKKMYKTFTGMDLKPKQQSYISSESYLDSIKRALTLDIGATEGYKQIRNTLPITSPYRDELLNIIIDELSHTDKFTYLFLINSIKEFTMSKRAGQDRTRPNLDDWRGCEETWQIYR